MGFLAPKNVYTGISRCQTMCSKSGTVISEQKTVPFLAKKGSFLAVFGAKKAEKCDFSKYVFFAR